jgi:drug/metabolite transporter (DMT)-like permease
VGAIYLTINILCSSLLFLIFKSFPKYKIQTSVAIVVNYFVAAALSFAVQGEMPSAAFFNYQWYWAALVLGICFISLFNLMGYTSQNIGIAQTTVANKTTFVFPVIIGMLFFGDSTHFVKILGLLCGILAVYFSAKKNKNTISLGAKDRLWIIVLFLGGGILDAVLSIAQLFLVASSETALFSGYLFLIAGLIGLAHLLYKVAEHQQKIDGVSILGGIILGIPNFASINYFLKSMSDGNIPNSVAFPVSNMGVIILASILGVIIYKESITLNKKWSVAFAILAILLVSLGEI